MVDMADRRGTGKGEDDGMTRSLGSTARGHAGMTAMGCPPVEACK